MRMANGIAARAASGMAGPRKTPPEDSEVTSAERFADDTKRGERMAVEAIGIYFDYRAKAFT